MIVHAYGGLCNRLRVVLSYLEARQKIDVVWVPNGEIAFANFEDVFAPIEGVTFYENFPVGVSDCDIVTTCDPMPGIVGWEHLYRQLLLRPTYKTYYDDLTVFPFSAVHVRRSDHHDYPPAIENHTTDEEFFDWISQQSGDVYVATCDGSTQKKYLSHLRSIGRKAQFAVTIDERENERMGGRRNTPLGEAAIDLFACAHAKNFMGSRESSFSNAIYKMRAIGGWWS
jgi:hypothetical protein